MGKKNKKAELVEDSSPENRKRKLNKKESDEAPVGLHESEEEPVQVKKGKKAKREESPEATPADEKTDLTKKKKNKNKGESATEVLSQPETSKVEDSSKANKKKKKKNKNGQNDDAGSQDVEPDDEAATEVPKKKPKKEKKKRDKSLDAFNSLKDNADDEVDDGKDAADNNGVEESKSSKKRDKKLKKPDHIHETKGHGKALRYLDAWNDLQNGKAGWKFEKCRQIWLLSHAYDKEKVPDSKFDILLKYMASIKGKMRESTLDSAKQKLSLEEKWSAAVEAGKTEATDLPVETRPSQKEVERAKEVVLMLETD